MHWTSGECRCLESDELQTKGRRRDRLSKHAEPILDETQLSDAVRLRANTDLPLETHTAMSSKTVVERFAATLSFVSSDISRACAAQSM
jgi:hypothetical protein